MKEELDLYVIERKTSNPRSQIVWKEGQKELIFDLYTNKKMGYKQIGNLFNEHLHYNTIKRIVEGFGGKIRNVLQSRQSDMRHDAFAIIDNSEKAYWLGFLMADGCIHNGYVKISLQKRDYHHLEKFKIFLKAEAKIAHTKTSQGEYCSIAIGSRELCNDLISRGCIERKSLVLKPNNDIPEEYIYDFIRGYWDGDGGISYSKKDNRWQAYCTSTKDMLDYFCQKLALNSKPFLEHNCKQTYRIHFNGRINVYKKMALLYKDATVSLDRKQKLFSQLEETMLHQ